jgi:hypothetical protein
MSSILLEKMEAIKEPLLKNEPRVLLDNSYLTKFFHSRKYLLLKLLVMKTFYLISLLIFFFSCASENKKSDKIKSEDVYQSYSINYDGNIAYIKAEFRVGAYWNRLETEKTGGEAVELVGPANVTFNGEKMNADNSVFTGAYYSLKKEGVLNGDVTWVWADNAGKKYTNTAKVNPIKLNEVSCSLNEDMVVTWEGLPVQEHETVNVTVEGNVNDKKSKPLSSLPM